MDVSNAQIKSKNSFYGVLQIADILMDPIFIILDVIDIKNLDFIWTDNIFTCPYPLWSFLFLNWQCCLKKCQKYLNVFINFSIVIMMLTIIFLSWNLAYLTWVRYKNYLITVLAISTYIPLFWSLSIAQACHICVVRNADHRH